MWRAAGRADATDDLREGVETLPAPENASADEAAMRRPAATAVLRTMMSPGCFVETERSKVAPLGGFFAHRMPNESF